MPIRQQTKTQGPLQDSGPLFIVFFAYDEIVFRQAIMTEHEHAHNENRCYNNFTIVSLTFGNE